jgi:uncharacterized protein (DUF2147 family)
MKQRSRANFLGLTLCVILAALAGVPWGALRAQPLATPAGLWQSIDDATGKPRAQIRISLAGEVFTGRIMASSTGTPAGGQLVCERCTDDRKNQPLIGMEIVRGIRQQAGAAEWAGGEILDPDKGSTYKLRLTLQDSGKQMQVRGYIGPFFRNQTWMRLE